MYLLEQMQTATGAGCSPYCLRMADALTAGVHQSAVFSAEVTLCASSMIVFCITRANTTPIIGRKTPLAGV